MDSRIRSTLLLYTYSVLGIFLLVAPWTPVWEHAAHGLLPEAVQPWALSGWIRGIVSGLGAVDLAVAAHVGLGFFAGDVNRH